MFRSLWLMLGLTSLVLGIVGVALPLLPTTPFVLLSAYCFARSSPRLHDWLLANRSFGPLINRWRQHRAIAPRTKLLAVGSMIGGVGVSLAIGVPTWVLIVQAVALSGAALFILTRPNGPKTPIS